MEGVAVKGPCDKDSEKGEPLSLCGLSRKMSSEEEMGSDVFTFGHDSMAMRFSGCFYFFREVKRPLAHT